MFWWPPGSVGEVLSSDKCERGGGNWASRSRLSLWVRGDFQALSSRQNLVILFERGGPKLEIVFLLSPSNISHSPHLISNSSYVYMIMRCVCMCVWMYCTRIICVRGTLAEHSRTVHEGTYHEGPSPRQDQQTNDTVQHTQSSTTRYMAVVAL